MRHRLVWVLVVPLLLVVGGCSGDPEPIIADPTSEATSSVEPVSDPPTSSPTSEPKPETAEEFIRRYAGAEAAMQNSGVTSDYLELTDSCSSCDSLANTVTKYYEAGGDIRWGGWLIREIRPYNGSPTEWAVTVDSPPTTFHERSGGPEMRIEGGRVTYLLRLSKTTGTWLIDETEQLAS